MSAKTPIIASNSSAIPELIKNNYNGFLFKEADHRDLANKMKLIENEKIRKKFSNNGFKFLNKNFGLHKMNILTTKIYQSSEK
jgi:glycosyltransferase involved in cell wall biosynthesis